MSLYIKKLPGRNKIWVGTTSACPPCLWAKNVDAIQPFRFC